MLPVLDFGVSRELAQVEAKIRASIQSEEPLLTDMASYVIEAGGKRIRPTVLLLSFYAAGGKSPERAVDIAAALELIHSATLIHDDINDGAEVRRGRAAAHRKFGIHNALIAGDFLFVKAFSIGGKFEDYIVDLTAEVCVALAEGEIQQKGHIGDVELTEEEYHEIIHRKTAFPIAAAAKTGALLAKGNTEVIDALGKYGENLGLAFQIVDDILDVTGAQHRIGKQPGTDIREGNVTLPAIRALNDGAIIDRSELIRILRKPRRDEGEIQQALRMIRDTRAIPLCYEDAKDFGRKAKAALDVVSDGPFKTQLIRLVDFVLQREA